MLAYSLADVAGYLGISYTRQRTAAKEIGVEIVSEERKGQAPPKHGYKTEADYYRVLAHFGWIKVKVNSKWKLVQKKSVKDIEAKA